ncbi:hypothetical protein [Actinacidiphila soli]|uniref:hypothetical protein n=1 Tax=Actinacidiphila soli TaxID=2487275 RepID=UPI0013E3EFE7|nr:hypothetical protein [Actinacidiphila soli]
MRVETGGRAVEQRPPRASSPGWARRSVAAFGLLLAPCIVAALLAARARSA